MPNLDPNPRAITFGSACRAFLELFADQVREGLRSAATLDMHRSHLRLLSEHLDERAAVTAIDEGAITEALRVEREGRRTMRDGTVKQPRNATLAKRLSTLRLVLEHARELGWIARVPALPVLRYRYVPDGRFLEHVDDFRAIFHALPTERALWFALAVFTGQRFSDVERMRREDMDPFAVDELGEPDPWVRVRSWKTRRGEPGIRVPMLPELVRVFADRWAALPPRAPLVEPWPHASSQLARTCERIGREPICANTCRHTFFTWQVAANGFLPELVELGGWKSPDMLLRVYAHAAPVRLRETQARTAALLARPRLPPRRAVVMVPPSAIVAGGQKERP